MKRPDVARIESGLDVLTTAVAVDLMLAAWLAFPFLAAGLILPLAWFCLTIGYWVWCVLRGRSKGRSSVDIRLGILEVITDRPLICFAAFDGSRNPGRRRLYRVAVAVSWLGMFSILGFVVAPFALAVCVGVRGHWPLAAGMLVVTTLVGLSTLGSPSMSSEGVRVVLLDSDREVQKVTTHERPAADKIEGIDGLTPYIERLAAFQGWRAHALVSSQDDSRVISLRNHDSVLSVGLSFGPKMPTDEPAAKQFFAVRSLEIWEAHGDPAKQRSVHWLAPQSAPDLVVLVKDVAVELAGISLHEPLNVRFSEYDERLDPDL